MSTVVLSNVHDQRDQDTAAVVRVAVLLRACCATPCVVSIRGTPSAACHTLTRQTALVLCGKLLYSALLW